MNSKEIKILLAEKDPVTTTFIRDALTDYGFKFVIAVDTAIDAITQVEAQKPDIIILDVLLNGFLTGLEAARIISYKYKTPLIFLSDNENKKLFDRDFTFETFACLLKPVNSKILISNIERCLTYYKHTGNFVHGGLTHFLEFPL